MASQNTAPISLNELLNQKLVTPIKTRLMALGTADQKLQADINENMRVMTEKITAEHAYILQENTKLQHIIEEQKKLLHQQQELLGKQAEDIKNLAMKLSSMDEIINRNNQNFEEKCRKQDAFANSIMALAENTSKRNQEIENAIANISWEDK